MAPGDRIPRVRARKQLRRANSGITQAQEASSVHPTDQIHTGRVLPPEPAPQPTSHRIDSPATRPPPRRGARVVLQQASEAEAVLNLLGLVLLLRHLSLVELQQQWVPGHPLPVPLPEAALSVAKDEFHHRGAEQEL